MKALPGEIAPSPTAPAALSPSKSDHPAVAAHRDVLHKIGVTGGDRRLC